MDIALCIIDTERATLEFAGAFFPIYIIRDIDKKQEISKNKIYRRGKNEKVEEEEGFELIQITADKMPIGIYYEKKKFTNHEVKVKTGDLLYMASDGYSDQFGGKRGRKFSSRRFKKILKKIHKLPLEEQKENLENEFLKWKDVEEQVDDVLVMGIKIELI